MSRNSDFSLASGSAVYFAQPTNGGPIKVGVTGGIKERMSMLAAWIPGGVEVIATIDGGAFREAYLKAARGKLERRCARAFMEQTWELRLEVFEDQIELPLTPAIEIVSISTSLYLVRAVSSAAGGITIA